MRFEVTQIKPQTSAIKGIKQVSRDIYIHDSVVTVKGIKSAQRHGSQLFVRLDMELKDVFAALADHMTLYYDVEPESLSMDVCRE